MKTTKKCPRCGELKNRETDFYRRSGAKKHLLRSWCKECESKEKKFWAKENREKVNLRRSIRYHTSEVVRQKHKEYSDSLPKDIVRKRNRIAADAYKARNRRKQYVHGVIRRNVFRGKIERKPCEVCGTMKDVQAHHEDYNKPFDVIWLCRIHHKELHRQKRLTERIKYMGLQLSVVSQ